MVEIQLRGPAFKGKSFFSAQPSALTDTGDYVTAKTVEPLLVWPALAPAHAGVAATRQHGNKGTPLTRHWRLCRNKVKSTSSEMP